MSNRLCGAVVVAGCICVASTVEPAAAQAGNAPTSTARVTVNSAGDEGEQLKQSLESNLAEAEVADAGAAFTAGMAVDPLPVYVDLA